MITDIPGAPLELQILDWDKNFVDLAWSPPHSDGGAEITNYVVGKKNKHKRFYDRGTIATLNYEIKQISSIPLHFYETQIINPFLNFRISANHDKDNGLSANGKILKKGIVSQL